MNKYKITAIEHPQYPWLHRIQALIDVNEKVPKGTIGGFVDSITNLSQGVGKYMQISKAMILLLTGIYEEHEK